MNEEAASKKKKIILIIVAAVILLLGIILFFLWRSKITATTMRILRIEGTVTLEEGGKNKTVKENLRLNSGNALSTALKSLVSIGLDDTKIVTLDERSRAVFEQSGRQLELKLTDGSLFFEVSQPLTDEESFDIKTSTMVVGIRGTSGWVSVDGEHESLIITDGVVHVIGTNPVTGEVKEIDVKAGQRITVYLYNDRNVDSIMFVLEEITERELPEFLLERLRENPTLLEKVCRETGWDKPWILGIKEEEPPKVVMENDDEDNGRLEEKTDIDDADKLLPDTGVEVETAPSDSDRDTILTQKELDWAHSHVAIVDPNTGIFALKDMTLFDPAFYAATNPDVVAKYGSDPDALLWHYLQRGKTEGRPPIAPPTPTPTPTPWWMYPQEETEESSEEPEEESEPTPTPTPVPTGQVVQNGPISIQTTGNPTGNNNWHFTLPNNVWCQLSSSGSGYLNGSITVPGGGNVTIPFEIKDTSGNTRTVSNLSDFDFSHCGNGYSSVIASGDFSITDSATGKTITKYDATNPSPFPNNEFWSVTDQNGTVTPYSNDTDAISAFNTP